MQQAKTLEASVLKLGSESKDYDALKMWANVGYKYYVNYSLGLCPFYDFNKAQQFLEKYLLLLSKSAT